MVSALKVLVLGGLLAFGAARAAAPPFTASCNAQSVSGILIAVDPNSWEMFSRVLWNGRSDLHDRLWRPEQVFEWSYWGSRGIALLYPDPQDSAEIGEALTADPVLKAAGLQGVIMLPSLEDVVYPNPPIFPLALTEYHHEGIGHYRLAAGRDEAARYDEGLEGPGWRRTGQQIIGEARSLHLGAVPVRRFRFKAGRNPGSPFFTTSAADCGLLRKYDWGLDYDRLAFEALPTFRGQCHGGLLPVFRSYNNRWMHDDSSHRFTTSFEEHRAMVARGWLDEGIAFCSYPPDYPTLRY